MIDLIKTAGGPSTWAPTASEAMQENVRRRIRGAGMANE
jgi:hypothetical protein